MGFVAKFLETAGKLQGWYIFSWCFFAVAVLVVVFLIWYRNRGRG